jgi:hypothetical protein
VVAEKSCQPTVEGSRATFLLKLGDIYQCMLTKVLNKLTVGAYHALIKKSNFPHIYKEIQNGAVAKSYMTNGSSYMGKYLRISSYIRKPFLILYMTLQLLHSEFPDYEENLIFFFIKVKELTGPRAKGLCRLWICSESLDHALQRKSDVCIPRKETAHSQPKL